MEALILALIVGIVLVELVRRWEPRMKKLACCICGHDWLMDDYGWKICKRCTVIHIERK